jgi:hypothetical protein
MRLKDKEISRSTDSKYLKQNSVNTFYSIYINYFLRVILLFYC